MSFKTYKKGTKPVEDQAIERSRHPRHISTSFIERQNLTLRQSQRRLTRLSNGFSKKYENLCAAIALYATHYNFCRIHETLRITPAMQFGITDHVWTISELVQAALSDGAKCRPNGRWLASV
ncbi:MAG TPA: hypothetical protein VJL82_08870 [Rhizomicrobium sp.]|nr:hypothetical protein [Rhizomicrobium sp.]